MNPLHPALPLGGGNPLGNLPGLSYTAAVLFVICVAAFFTLRWLYGRGLAGKPGMGRRFIRVIDRFPLAPQRYLLIIEVAGKTYLLGVTEQSISFLTPLDPEALSKDPAWLGQTGGNFAPFNSYLSALSRRWKKNKEEPPHE